MSAWGWLIWMVLLPSLSWAADFALLKTPLPPLTGAQAELVVVSNGNTLKIKQSKLERLPIYQTTLSTHWRQRGNYQGVLLTDVLHAYKLRGQPIKLLAQDGYQARLSVADYEGSPAILATRLDGHSIGLADKGPFILLWPEKEVLALMGKMRLSDWIWSVSEISAP